MKSAFLKKTLVGTMALALSMSGFSDLTAVTQVQGAQSKAETALIKKATALAAKDDEGLMPTYGLFDLTGDDVPELFYARHYARTQISVFYYDASSKKVKPMKTTDGEKSLGGVSDVRAASSGNKIIVSMSDSAYSGAVSTYKATKKNKLKAVTTYEYNYDSNKFKKNGKKITKSAFEKYQKKTGKLDSVDFGTSLTEATDTQETSINAAVATEDMYVGTWAEKISERVIITVDPAIGDEGWHDVQITWREDLPQKDVYDMRAKYQEDGSMYYDNCRHVIRTFNDDGTFEDEIKYENGSGLLNIDLDAKLLYWTDYEEDKESESRVQTFIKETSTFQSDDGWSVKYDSFVITANTEDNGASFVYVGESAGSNLVSIKYIANKKPEEVLKELTKDWSAEDAKTEESAYPGKEGQTAYRCVLGTSTDDTSNLQQTLIAGEYKDGTLLFDLSTHNSNNEEIDMAVSDALSDILNSITYETASK